MDYFTFCVLIFYIILDSYNATEYHQERGVIKNYNPKYVSQAHSFTARRGRTDIYTTNASFTNIHVWNNNVTFKLIYKLIHQDLDFSWKIPVCDLYKIDWAVEYLTKYSDIPAKCPLQMVKPNISISPCPCRRVKPTWI